MEGQMKLKYLLSILILVFSANISAEGNFKLIGSSSYETLSYDTDNIRFVMEFDHLYVEAWVKHQPTLEGAKEYIQERQKDKLIIEGFENFSYYIDHKLFSLNKMSCWIDSIDYAKDGHVLDKKYYPMQNWQPVAAGSVGEVIWFAVMEYAKDNQLLLESRTIK
jgi:hypothetical protein